MCTHPQCEKYRNVFGINTHTVEYRYTICGVSTSWIPRVLLTHLFSFIMNYWAQSSFRCIICASASTVWLHSTILQRFTHKKKNPYPYLNECLPFQVTAWSTLATQTQSWMVCHSVPWTEIMTGTVVTVPLSTVGDGGSTTVMTPILTDRGPLTTGTSLGTPL